MNWHTLLYWCPVNKRRRRDRPQTGVLTPGTGTSTKLSPERATEYITCLISNCLYFCRPFGTFHVVAQLPGVNTPVCGLSRLQRFSPDSNILAISPSQTLDGCEKSRQQGKFYVVLSSDTILSYFHGKN